MRHFTSPAKIILKIYRHSLQDIFTMWQSYLWLSLGLFFAIFFSFIFPIILGMSISKFFSTPGWLGVSLGASYIVIVAISSIFGEIIQNKRLEIYLITKNVSRFNYLLGKILSQLTISFIFAILLFLMYLIIDGITYRSINTSIFRTDICWYGLFISFIILALFGSSSLLLSIHLRTGITSLVLILIIGVGVFLLPEIWPVTSSDHFSNARMWFTLYMPLAIYLPLALTNITTAGLIYNRMRINI